MPCKSLANLPCMRYNDTGVNSGHGKGKSGRVHRRLRIPSAEVSTMVKAIVGANWGDEGKGKVTDLLC